MPTILLKRNSVSGFQPAIDEIELGEISINTADGVLYTKIFKNGLFEIVSIGGSELEKVENQTGTRYGWRLKTDTPENFLDTGAFSVTLSQSSDSQNKTGASGDFATTFGNNTIASGIGSIATGLSTQASGEASHTEGTNTIASSGNAHAEGLNTVASNGSSHAEGENTRAEANASHAEGGYTIASGEYSHTEGSYNVASGGNAHAEGFYTKAAGQNSHAEGYYTTANGMNSHASGFMVTANNTNQTVIGTYNNDQNTNTIFEVGIGSNSGGIISYKNGLEVYKTGEVVVPEETTALIDAGPARILVTKEWVQANTVGGSELEKITENGNIGWALLGDERGGKADIGNHAIDFSYVDPSSPGNGTYGASGDYSFAEGYKTQASGYASHAEGGNTKAIGNYSHVEGYYATAGGTYSHAEGFNVTAANYASHAEGNYTTADGRNSHAEGYNTYATGDNSHAEGYYVTASGENSHAEGSNTIAGGKTAHAEGFNTRADGDYSHADGIKTYATGYASHTSGHHTKATSSFMSAFGTFNVDNPNSIFEIGIGNTSGRGNALEVYKTGEVFAPSMTPSHIDSSSGRVLTTKEWVQANTGGGAQYINDLLDVDTSTTQPQVESYLEWDGTNWVPTEKEHVYLDDLADVDTTTATPANGQVLKWDGSNWIPGDGGTTINSLDDIGDVNVTGVQNGQFIQWNSGTSSWEAVDLPAGGNLLSDGSIPMDTGYTPTNNQDIATKNYVDTHDINGGEF